MDNREDTDLIHRATLSNNGLRWPALEATSYNAAPNQSRGVTKQVLFESDERLPAVLRYFEAEPGGFSALERHEHVHAVVVLRGSGSILVGDTVYPIVPHDTVYIPPMTWHQLYADDDTCLGFLCMVSAERDRPMRPSSEEIDELRKNPAISHWIRA